MDIQDGMEGNVLTHRNTRYPQVLRYLGVILAVSTVVLGFQFVQRVEAGTFLQFLLPIPVVLISLRYASLWMGIVTVLAATGLIRVTTDSRGALFFLATIGIVALVFAGTFLRNCPATTSVSWVSVYYIGLGIILAYLQPGDTFDVYQQRILQVLKEQIGSLSQYNDLRWQDVSVQMEAVARVFGLLVPLFAALSTSIFMYLSLRFVLRLYRMPLAPLGPFRAWRVSDSLVWLVVFGGICYHFEATKIMGLNLLVGIVFLYYLNGCAVIVGLFKSQQTTKLIQFVIYMLLFLQIPYIFISVGLLLTGAMQKEYYLSLPVILIVASIGLANVWLDFRQRPQEGNE